VGVTLGGVINGEINEVTFCDAPVIVIAVVATAPEEANGAKENDHVVP
jgi:hypothetical protein